MTRHQTPARADGRPRATRTRAPRTRALTDAQRAAARDELRRLDGDPPYNTPGNICYYDGYYARSLEQQYGRPLDVLRRELDG